MDSSPANETRNEASAGLITPSELLARPAEYVGDRAWVTSGEVYEVYGARALSVGGPDWKGGELRVLLPEAREVAKGDVVIVRGQLKLLSRNEIQTQLGVSNWPQLVDQNNVLFSASSAVVSLRAQAPLSARALNAGAGQNAPGETIYDLRTVVSATDLERPRMEGRPVDLVGARVQSRMGSRNFWLGPNAHEQLFVRVSPGPAAGLSGGAEPKVGELVSVEGTLKTLPPLATLQSQWGLDPTTSKLLSRDGVFVEADTVLATPPPTSERSNP